MEPIERALRRPEAYPPPRPPHVEVFETHCSLVFVAGDRAYKVKKQVRSELDNVRNLGKEASAYAEQNQTIELEYYDIMCAPTLGAIP